MDQEIQITPKKATFYLQNSEGELFRDIIDKHVKTTFKAYCRDVGILDSNVLGVLNGTKPGSTDFLQRLLSGTGIKMTCTLTISLESSTKKTPEKDSLSKPEGFLDDFGTEYEDVNEF